MATQRDDTKERDAVNKLAERLRAVEQSRLLERGIELWTSTENATLHTVYPPARTSH